MASYPVEIRRCHHIKTSGAQCGSPAVKDKDLCYYHQQNRPAPAELYLDGDRYPDSSIMLPPFEDAHSIQMMLRHVVQLLLCRRIDRKDAGLALYALQIASGNLKQMQAEKPKPTQVVVEPEKVAETPLGMTPWSATGEGHDPDEEDEAEDREPDCEQDERDDEDDEDGDDEDSNESDPDDLPPQELCQLLTADERRDVIDEWLKEGRITQNELHDYMTSDGPDPILLAICRVYDELKQRIAALHAKP